MYDIDELIKYHHECDFLDFKQEEYNENNKPHLIKDILAFSNANIKGDRYIIIGVHKKDEDITLFNIESKFDSAHIQQYVHANITPELNIEYFPYTYDGYNLMVLIIKEPSELPYMTQKDVKYPKGAVCLKANECWIRKGSYQLTASRSDIDKMYALKVEQSGFIGNVSVTFTKNETDCIEIDCLKNIEYPSDKNRKRIEKIIKDKEELKKVDNTSYQLSISHPLMPWQGTTYEERSIETLKKNLEDVDDTYADQDFYYLFEEMGFKLNLDIYNDGINYLEDASIEVKICKIEKLLIADRVHFVHRENSSPYVSYSPRMSSFDELNYPTVIENEDYYIIKEDIGNIKHNIKQRVFKTPIRLVIGKISSGTEILLDCRIFGKNLKKTIERELKIIVR